MITINISYFWPIVIILNTMYSYDGSLTSFTTLMWLAKSIRIITETYKNNITVYSFDLWSGIVSS